MFESTIPVLNNGAIIVASAIVTVLVSVIATVGYRVLRQILG